MYVVRNGERERQREREGDRERKRETDRECVRQRDGEGGRERESAVRALDKEREREREEREEDRISCLTGIFTLLPKRKASVIVVETGGEREKERGREDFFEKFSPCCRREKQV